MNPILIIIAVFVAWIGTLIGVTSYFPDWTTRGQFGDLFGSLNALFSGLAFAGLIYTIFLQRKELELQRKELQLQREEMEKSRAELAEQAKVQKALFVASIAQLKADASAARIEADKLAAEAKGPSFRSEEVQSIRNEAKNIDASANALDQMNDNG